MNRAVCCLKKAKYTFSLTEGAFHNFEKGSVQNFRSLRSRQFLIRITNKKFFPNKFLCLNLNYNLFVVVISTVVPKFWNSIVRFLLIIDIDSDSDNDIDIDAITAS